jgi:hypothetical protein
LGESAVANVMTEKWSLDYERLGDMNTVWPVDKQAIEHTLQRLDGTEISRCGLTNETDRCWLACRGSADKHLIEYVSSPRTCFRHIGAVRSRIFFLARKKPVDRRAMRIPWKSHPDVFVDVRADAVLELSEAIAIFTTFFETKGIHQDFTTIPKPLNGYL